MGKMGKQEAAAYRKWKINGAISMLEQGVRTVRVFDVSQTDGEELPSVCHELTGSVDGCDGSLISPLVEASPCPVTFAHVAGEAHGFYSHDTRSITVDDGMAEEQTVKTLVHEIAHATLHALPCKLGDLGGRRRGQGQSISRSHSQGLRCDHRFAREPAS
jgi:hypothetical protein